MCFTRHWKNSSPTVPAVPSAMNHSRSFPAVSAGGVPSEMLAALVKTRGSRNPGGRATLTTTLDGLQAGLSGIIRDRERARDTTGASEVARRRAAAHRVVA